VKKTAVCERSFLGRSSAKNPKGGSLAAASTRMPVRNAPAVWNIGRYLFACRGGQRPVPDCLEGGGYREAGAADTGMKDIGVASHLLQGCGRQ